MILNLKNLEYFKFSPLKGGAVWPRLAYFKRLQWGWFYEHGKNWKLDSAPAIGNACCCGDEEAERATGSHRKHGGRITFPLPLPASQSLSSSCEQSPTGRRRANRNVVCRVSASWPRSDLRRVGLELTDNKLIIHISIECGQANYKNKKNLLIGKRYNKQSKWWKCLIWSWKFLENKFLEYKSLKQKLWIPKVFNT